MAASLEFVAEVLLGDVVADPLEAGLPCKVELSYLAFSVTVELERDAAAISAALRFAFARHSSL